MLKIRSIFLPDIHVHRDKNKKQHYKINKFIAPLRIQKFENFNRLYIVQKKIKMF